MSRVTKLHASLSNPYFLCVYIAISLTLAFPLFSWPFFGVLTAAFLVLLSVEVRSLRAAFGFGFLASFLSMLGCTYWQGYVLHEFGQMSWPFATLMLLLVSGFEAFNFPVFIFCAFLLNRKLGESQPRSPWRELWFLLGLPALYVVIEFLVPKEFPWYLGETLYQLPVFVQVSELSGSISLSFLLFSIGSSLALWFLSAPRKIYYAIPASLIAGVIIFGLVRLNQEIPSKGPFHALLVQGNIGSIEKEMAEKGAEKTVRYVFDRFESMTEAGLANRDRPRPDLIMWPETALPIFFNLKDNYYVEEIKDRVARWGVPLLTGAYTRSSDPGKLNANSAYLIIPTPESSASKVAIQTYDKNLLLPFGEFLPGTKTFPLLGKLVPEVPGLEPGNGPGAFVLGGNRFGITICYEGLHGGFYRRAAAHGAVAVFNLTNDSWFGPTNEPWTHAGFTAFRAVENRIPLLRVANTGITYFVDDRGRIHEPTDVFRERVVYADIDLPAKVVPTLYATYGDWFVVFCFFLAAGLYGAAYFLPKPAEIERDRVDTKLRYG